MAPGRWETAHPRRARVRRVVESAGARRPLYRPPVLWAPSPWVFVSPVARGLAHSIPGSGALPLPGGSWILARRRTAALGWRGRFAVEQACRLPASFRDHARDPTGAESPFRRPRAVRAGWRRGTLGLKRATGAWIGGRCRKPSATPGLPHPAASFAFMAGRRYHSPPRPDPRPLCRVAAPPLSHSVRKLGATTTPTAKPADLPSSPVARASSAALREGSAAARDILARLPSCAGLHRGRRP